MRKVNQNMKRILKNINNKKENIIKIDLNELEKIINPNIIEVHDCVILDLENRIVKQNIDFDFILKRFGDKVGYEASRNEIRVNDYIIEGSFNSIVKLSFKIIEYQFFRYYFILIFIIFTLLMHMLIFWR